MTQPAGELFDLGYQHYDGPREGRMRARKAVFVSGIRTTLGIGQGPLAKVLPIVMFVFVMAPAVIMALVASQTGDLLDLPDHSDYYQVVSVILIIFSAIIAPELLCPDRRNGVMSLYLVRPLTGADYVFGRWAAFFSITLLLVYSGQIILLAGLVLSAADPAEYLRDNWLDIPRFLGAGFLIALFTSTLPLAVASFTTRRAFAATAVIGLYVISAAVGAILTDCEDHSRRGQGPGNAFGDCEPITGDAAKWISLVNIGGVPNQLSDKIFGVEGESRRSRLVSQMPDVVPVGWYVVMVGGLAGILWWRYSRLSV